MPLTASLKKILRYLLPQDQAGQLLRQTAREQWRLIALNLVSNLVAAATEGAILAVVFLAVEVLTAPAGGFNWATNPLLSWWPSAAVFFNELPVKFVFISLLGVAVVLQALQSLSVYLSGLSVGFFTARCKTLITALIHSQVLSFSFPCASRYRVGELSDYSTRGPEAIRVQIDMVSGLAVSLVMAITYLVVLVGISPWLLLAVLLMGGLITFLQKYLLPRITASSKTMSREQAQITSQIIEDFQGLRLLHSYGQLDEADQRLRRRMRGLELEMRAQVRRLGVVGPFSNFLPILAIALIGTLSLLLLGERNSGVLPSLVTFVLALQRLNVRLTGIASQANHLANNRGALDRLNQILVPEGKQFRRQSGRPFKSLHREIRFQSVGLSYNSGLPPALSDISFALPKGQTLALVGSSGAGKSSIADLFTGLYAPTTGQIFLDDMPLEQIELTGWQKRIGVVSQDTFLFNDTIANNISFGTPGMTSSQIHEACKAAQAAGFIKSLPQGFDTLVGERGYRLSGGQRQRLSLARAILRDPDLLILDEATSALDSESERLVQQAIERFERNHTVLVIAHRLSTVVHADQICVMESGRIVERGTHQELLNLDQRYARLWKSQSILR